MTVSPSSKTYSNIYNELNQFISNNHSLEKLTANAKEAGYNLVSDATVTKDDQLLGSVQNSRQVIRWAFQNDKGAISEIFECNDKFVVAAMKGSLDEGYRPVELVAAPLKAELIAQKKGEQIAAALAAKNLTSVEAYAEAMGAKVDSVKFVNFATRRISGIGIEPNLNAAVAMAQVDQVSAPVKGNNGVYVYQIISQSKQSGKFDAKLQEQMAIQMHMRNLNNLTSDLYLDGKVVDKRYLFF